MSNAHFKSNKIWHADQRKSDSNYLKRPKLIHNELRILQLLIEELKCTRTVAELIRGEGKLRGQLVLQN